MKKLLIGLFGILLSFNCLSESYTPTNQNWYGPFTIDKAAYFYDGSSYFLTIHVKETPETACEVTNSMKKFAWKSSGTVLATNLTSLAVAAQAQNKKIMLLAKDTCREGLGLEFRGVEILSE
ncbi:MULTISPECIES: hypothetical protein [Vibrio harveyi group]|uniref:hypothetical protein n=1 Tax=Vibrio harveyi group TaxID=717610 RepID=UPI000597460E|nr:MULTISPECIES: hypothetical protein [Vibrio harveyi group]QLK46367.1 hypothetical protein DR996_14840 [Vibrio owensii]